jgi:6,7-dimethyl-8-ribityllumazine synthase
VGNFDKSFSSTKNCHLEFRWAILTSRFHQQKIATLNSGGQLVQVVFIDKKLPPLIQVGNFDKSFSSTKYCHLEFRLAILTSRFHRQKIATLNSGGQF